MQGEVKFWITTHSLLGGGNRNYRGRIGRNWRDFTVQACIPRTVLTVAYDKRENPDHDHTLEKRNSGILFEKRGKNDRMKTS